MESQMRLNPTIMDVYNSVMGIHNSVKDIQMFNNGN